MVEKPGRKLRLKALTLSPETIGIQSTTEFPRVYGMVVDWPTSEVIVTIIALADGSASIYTSSGSCIIGGYAHESVRREALPLVKIADAYYDNARSASDEFPYPSSDTVQYYLLGFDGIRVINAELRSVENGKHPTAQLFDQAQFLMAEIRVMSKPKLIKKRAQRI